MNKHTLIVDKVAQSLVKVNESKGTNINKFILHGTFTKFDIENRNKWRGYDEPVIDDLE